MQGCDLIEKCGLCGKKTTLLKKYGLCWSCFDLSTTAVRVIIDETLREKNA